MATALAETPGSPTFRLDPRRCVPIRRVVSSITGRRVISFWIIRSILRAFLNGAPRFSFEVYMSPKYKYEPFLGFCNQRFCLSRKLVSFTKNIIDAFVTLAFGHQRTTNSPRSHHISETSIPVPEASEAFAFEGDLSRPQIPNKVTHPSEVGIHSQSHE